MKLCKKTSKVNFSNNDRMPRFICSATKIQFQQQKYIGLYKAKIHKFIQRKKYIGSYKAKIHGFIYCSDGLPA
jgi:hypothetical protein